MATCLQNLLVQQWGLASTLGAACGSDCSTPSSFFLDFVKHTVAKYPQTAFGLVESTDDSTIAPAYSYGWNDCMGGPGYDAGTFAVGLDDMRTQLASLPNFGSFIFAGTDHTSTQSPTFYTRTTTTADGGTVALTDWIASLLASSNVTNQGP